MNHEAPARNRYAQALAGGRIMNKELRMFYVIASCHSGLTRIGRSNLDILFERSENCKLSQ